MNLPKIGIRVNDERAVVFLPLALVLKRLVAAVVPQRELVCRH